MKSYVLIALFLLCLPFCLPIVAEQNQDSVKRDGNLITADDAVSRALNYTGFDQFIGFSRDRLAPPDLISIDEDRTPFLSSQIIGKQVWRIRISGVNLRAKSIRNAAEDADSRTFEILIAAMSGELLKIVSKSPIPDSNISEEPPILRSEKQLMESGEKYCGFVPSPVPISLAVALDSCMFGAYLAKDINALLVMYTKAAYENYHDPKPVWIITLRGIPPLATHGPRNAQPVPIYQRNYIREAIDATTGQGLFATTKPTVESRK